MKTIGASLLPAILLPMVLLAAIQARADTRGFLITSLAPAIYDGGEKSCPEGTVTAPDTQAFLAKMTKSERERMLQPGNRTALARAACKAAGSGIQQAQEQPANKAEAQPAKDQKEAARFKTVKGKVALGFDLNRPLGNTRPAYQCKHENFVSPEGEPGIDHQWYRAVGCLQTFRPGGALYEYFNTGMRNGEFSILLTIEGMDDPVNDDEVLIGLHTAADPKAVAKLQSAAAPAVRIHDDKYYQAVARGKITGGVITTEPVHVRLLASRLFHELNIRDARIKLQLEPDGRLKGLLGGYQDIVHLIFWAFNHPMESQVPGGPTLCPDFAPTIRALADGYPDPKDAGPCGWISTAYQIEAVPAAVVGR